MHAKKTAGTIRVEIADLLPHCTLTELFDELPWRALEELAGRMRGATPPGPVEVLPDRRTVVVGYEAIRAAGEVLGRDRIDAVLRADLAALGPAAVEARVIEGQLPLVPKGDRAAFARAWVRVRDLGCGRRGAGLTGEGHLALCEKVIDAAGMSARSLDRYARLMGNTPPTVLEAMQSRRLTVHQAEAVASAPMRLQEQIAREIKAGTDPREAVRSLPPAAATRTGDALKRLLATLPGQLKALEGRADSIRVSAEHGRILERGAKLLTRLAGRALSEEEAEAEMARLLDEVLDAEGEDMDDEA